MGIYKEEGLTTLWRGATPTMARAMALNAAQLATYSQAKQAILSSGYIQVDIMKTRLQSMKYVDGVPEYKGAGDVLLKVVKNEGFFSLWKGFTPYYFRLGPHTVLTFIFLEQANMAYKLHVLGIKGGSGGL